MLAVTAALLVFRFHRGLIEVIVVMALLGDRVNLLVLTLSSPASPRCRASGAAGDASTSDSSEKDDDAGQRQQRQRREHARDVEPVTGFGNAIGQARACARRARGDFRNHRADQRQPAGDPQAAQR